MSMSTPACRKYAGQVCEALGRAAQAVHLDRPCLYIDFINPYLTARWARRGKPIDKQQAYR